MKNLKVIFTAIVVCVAMLIPASLAAQQVTPVLVIGGSSAMFNTLGYAAFEYSPTLGYNWCGANHWTYKSTTGLAVIHDGRSTSIPDENGTIWVSWNGSADGVTTPPTRVCAYINLDSTIGVRATMAVPQAVLGLTVPVGTPGQSKIPGTTLPDSPIPASVIADLNGQPIGVAAADIRPEDAKFATTRALTAQGTTVPLTTLTYVKGLGYGGVAPGIGYGIESSQSSAIATPVDFALWGNDPITGDAAYSNFATIAVGSGPVIVFANTSNSATGHLGDPNLTNINSFVLAGVLDGTFSRTRDLFSAEAGDGVFPLKAFIREPLSGTMNTIEYNVTSSYRVLSTQEKGVTVVSPLPATNNPLALAGTVTGSGRFRVVGTGEMISTVIKAANADSLGYAFWGYSNFSAVTSSSIARYLSVDGVDPLYASPSANPNGVGVFPVVSSGVYPAIPFTNILNGSYPIWTTFRLVVPNVGNGTYSSNYNAAMQLAAVAQTDMATKIYDFVPQTSMTVFRSHFYQQGIGPENGTRVIEGSSPTAYYPDEGGEVGGAVYPLQADYDTIIDTGAELWQRHQ